MNQKVFYEPTDEEFHAAYGGAADAPRDGYEIFADLKYKEAYDWAKENGYGIVRVSQTFGKERAGYEIAKTVLQGALGVDEGFTGGLATSAVGGVAGQLGDETVTPESRAIRESDPVARAAGNVAGALSPFSVPSRIGGTAAKAVGLTGGAALGRGATGQGVKQALKRAGQVGAAGAITTAAHGAIQDVGMGAEDLAGGQTPETLDPGELLKRTLLRGATGFGIGAGGSLTLGQLGSRLAQSTREDSEVGSALLRAEEAGARAGGKRASYSNSPLGRIPFLARPQKTPSMKKLNTDSVYDTTISSPPEQAARAIRDPMLRAATKESRELSRLTTMRDTYYESPAGVTPQSMQPMGDSLLSALKKTQLNGADAPGLGPNATKLAELWAQTYEQLSEKAAKAYSGIKPPGFRWTTPEENALLGMGKPVLVRPRKVTASKLDELIAQYDDKAKWGADGQEIWKEVSKGARAVSDQFPAGGGIPAGMKHSLPDGTEVTGLSAMRGRIGNARRSDEFLRQATGLPADRLKTVGVNMPDGTEQMVPHLPADQLRGWTQLLTRFKSASSDADMNRALVELAKRAGATQGLRDLGGLNALFEVVEASPVLGRAQAGKGGLSSYSSFTVPGAKIQTYPTSKGLANMFGLGPGVPRVETPAQFRGTGWRGLAQRLFSKPYRQMPNPERMGRSALAIGFGNYIRPPAVSKETLEAVQVLERILEASKQSSQQKEVK
jgi:hypothetical protein